MSFEGMMRGKICWQSSVESGVWKIESCRGINHKAVIAAYFADEAACAESIFSATSRTSCLDMTSGSSAM